MRNIIFQALVLLTIVSCAHNDRDPGKDDIKKKEDIDGAKKDKDHQDFKGGNKYLTEEAFGDIIELEGKSHPVENVFRVSETEMIAKNNLLIVKNHHDDHVFMAYSLPGFKLVKSFGKRGKGPFEFKFPALIPTDAPNVLCYIYENTNNKLFVLDNHLNIRKADITIPQLGRAAGEKDFHSFSDSNFVYVRSAKGGKKIFNVRQYPDSVSNKEIHNLSFSKDYNNWAAYIGEFGANKNKGRLVYAYKYFKRLVFLDDHSNKKKTLIFEQDKTESGNATQMLSPENVTHYWGLSARDQFVYLLYSGRTPIQVLNDGKKDIEYIYVEQYDWNGNPVRKFKLDRWGYFCVGENEKVIYLVSPTEEQPFFSYQLPD